MSKNLNYNEKKNKIMWKITTLIALIVISSFSMLFFMNNSIYTENSKMDLQLAKKIPSKDQNFLFNIQNNKEMVENSILLNNTLPPDPIYATNIPVNLPDSSVGVIKSKYNSVGPSNPDELISTMITLKYQHQTILDQFLSDVQNNTSPIFHHFLSPAQFINNFSPNETVYISLTSFFINNGLNVSKYRDRVSFNVIGTISQFEQIFHTKIMEFKINNDTFFAPSNSLTIDNSFGDYINGITGLNSFADTQIHPFYDISGGCTNQGFNCPPEAQYGSDFQHAFQLDQIYSNSGYPVGITVATILWSGKDSSGNSVGPYYPADIQNYFSNHYPSTEPQPQIYADPVAGAALPGISSTKDVTGTNYESTLDLEMAGSTAPGANIVEVYGPSATSANLDKCFEEILNPQTSNPAVNSALQHVVAISNSWGRPLNLLPDYDWDIYTSEAAARGITVLASSGDNRQALEPWYPSIEAYNSYGTIAVGGTISYLNGQSSSDGTGTIYISKQTTWADNILKACGSNYNDYCGSQGGVGDFYQMPSWQQNSQDAYNVISEVSGISTFYRGGPDIAGVATNVFVYITDYNGYSSLQNMSGTSIASPLVAGEIASMDNYLLSHSLGLEGYFEPTLYNLGQWQYNQPADSNPINYFPFNDVTTGSSYYPAKVGYDLATGWGSINALNFVQDQYYGLTYTNPPIIVITDPNPIYTGSILSSTFTFSATASSFYGITAIYLELDTSTLLSFNTFSNDPASASWTTTVTTSAYASGYHYLRVIAYSGTYTSATVTMEVVFPSPPPPPVGGGCVAQNTNISMADGSYQKVQSLKTGDLLEGFSFQNWTTVQVQLINITVTHVSELLSINDKQLELTTTDQPIFMRNASFMGWIRDPKDLQVGDELFNPVNQSWIRINSLTFEHGNFKVYDIETAPYNNFIANGMLLDRKA